MLATIWDCLRARYHIHRGVPSTWPEPEIDGELQVNGAHRFTGTHHLPKSATFHQIGNAVVCSAVDELLDAGNWQKPDRWGSLLVAFPESKEPWDVPTQSWHLDFPATRQPGLTGVRIFTCLDKLMPGGGGTLFVAGSHRLVRNLVHEGESLHSAAARKRLIATHPWVKALCSRDQKTDRIKRFMNDQTEIDGVKVRVVEMTGESGDVFLADPQILHAPAQNCSAIPRFVLSTTAFRAGVASVKLYR